MRAVRIDCPGSIELVELEEPKPAPGEVVVDIAYAGICRSDVDLLVGRRPPGFVRYPVIPGHEWSGVVVEVGTGVDPDLLDRKVVGEGIYPCHVCSHCQAGDGMLCEAGYDETGFTRQGAWAEHLALPAAHLHVLAHEADLRSGAGLEPAACAADAVARAAVRPGDRVVVIGGGTIGTLCVQLLRGTFAAEIVVVEPDRRRAEVAGCCGATSTLHPDEASTRNETFDVVIEAAGVPSAARTSVELARRSGRIVLAGIPDQTATLVVRDVVSKRLEIATTFGAPHGAWRAAVDAFNAGRLDPGQLVTHELDLAGAADALALLARGGDEIGKILLRP